MYHLFHLRLRFCSKKFPGKSDESFLNNFCSTGNIWLTFVPMALYELEGYVDYHMSVMSLITSVLEQIIGFFGPKITKNGKFTCLEVITYVLKVGFPSLRAQNHSNGHDEWAHKATLARNTS